MSKKVCTKCKELKELNEFGKSILNKDGHQYHCKVCKSLYNKEYNTKNKDNIKICKTVWNNNNQNKNVEYKRISYIKNKDKIRAAQKEYTKKYYTKEKRKEIQRKKSIRMKNDLNFKLRQNLSCRLNCAIRNQNTTKSSTTLKLVGCTIDFLVKYIESQFVNGMSWSNYGQRGWHIDHIIPCDAFDLTNQEQQKECFHYTNLQPLWWLDNIKKGNKYENENKNKRKTSILTLSLS